MRGALVDAPSLRVGSCFSGIGLLDYGLHLAGLHHAWFCERDEWRRRILGQRWPGVPVFDDIRRDWRDAPRVDVIAGGFPCKGASTAGKREGFGHPETVLWRDMRRAIGVLGPRYVLVENVANLLSLHDGAVWGTVLGDLASLGYGVVWDCLPAAAVGAPHRRDRVFAVATHAEDFGSERGGLAWAGRSGSADCRVGDDASPDAARDAEGGPGSSPGADRERARASDYRGVRVDWGEYEPAIRRWEHVHGPAPEPLVRRVDARGAARVERSRLSALGDGVQVQVGRIAGEYIMSLERERCVPQ